MAREMRKKPVDHLLILCKQQGYVPEKCYLDGQIVWRLIQGGEDPCKKCNADRLECNGRRKLCGNRG